MDLYNFNPVNRSIIIDGDAYELSPFSVKVLTIVNEKYGTINEFENVLKLANNGIDDQKFKDCVSWLSYTLLIDKPLNLEDFKLRYLTQPEIIRKKNIKSLLDTISDSQPTRKEGGTGEEPSFSRIYAEVVRETGFLVDYFYSLTFKQIDQLVTDLSDIKNKENEFLAAIHGAKLNKTASNTQNITFTKEEDEFFEDFSNKQLEKLKNERAYS